MHVNIVNTPKSTMQSGRAGLGVWMLEPDNSALRGPESLMGWTASTDTNTTLRGKLSFAKLEDAVAHAKQQGWEYTVVNTGARKLVPRNYVQNFKYVPPETTDTTP